MSNVEEAVGLFRQGYGCSQAIAAAYGPAAGLDRECALKVASGFAGGMRMAETCGAVTGALMVLGLRHAGVTRDRAALNARVVEYLARFRERRGTVVCRELLGCDISKPEGAALARERGLFGTVCADLVREAARILEGEA